MPRRLLSTSLVTAMAAAATLAATLTPASTVSAATVPSGFTDSTVAAFSAPTAVEWIPGDRIVVLEKSGRIRVGRPGTTFATAIDLAVCTGSERGLLGLTPDPGFQGNGLVYVYYTRPEPAAPGDCVNRVSRFQMVGDTINPASELVLLDNISSVNGNHNGGDLDIGPDGHLYVSVGDAGADPRGDSGSGGGNDAAQDRSLLNGKILRITRTGQPAPGNPFTGSGTAPCATRGNTAATPTTVCQEIYAYGLRNPWRIAFDHNDGAGRFFINDVGQSTREEVDEAQLGANYGWPMREGQCPTGQNPPCDGPATGLTDPITDYPRSEGTYITAGAFVPDGLWPDAYEGGYLFADGGSGDIWLRTAAGAVDYGNEFATGAFGIVDMTFGFDTDGRAVLYYVSSGGGELRKITPPALAAGAPLTDLTIDPVTPFRAYDTNGVGVAAGRVHNATTRLVDLDPPAGTRAALVNLTYAATAGPGFLRVWGPDEARPGTSSVNAQAAGAFVANTAIVPLDADGAFVFESTTTARVIVDVMGWMSESGGTATAGRFVSLDPARLVDTRVPAGEALESGSPNPWTATASGWDLEAAGQLGVPDDGTAAAVVLSIGAIAGDGPGGYVGAYPANDDWPGNSNVNVVPGDVRANMVVVPLGGGSVVGLETLNIAHVVVDVLGYVTAGGASDSAAGLYTAVEPNRVVDTRRGLGFPTLQPLATAEVDPGLPADAAAVVQNLTVTRTDGPGFVTAHPADELPVVSSLNYTAADQTRAVLAFSPLAVDGTERFTSSAGTDLVVDVLGYFTGEVGAG